MVEISVVIPSYNRAHLLPAAVGSATAQDFTDMEILIVDDGSSDDTKAVVADLRAEDPRIRLVEHVKNAGEAAARNTGLREAQGRYIAFLDSDDIWLEGKLKRQYALLQEAEGTYQAVVCNYESIWPDGTKRRDNHWHFNKPITARNLLINGCGIGLGLNVMMEREAALATGVFDETMKLYVDLDWICRFLKSYRMAAINEMFSVYRKADFRPGDFVDAAATEFASKNDDLLRSWGWWTYRQAMAQLKWDAAASYQANGEQRQFARLGGQALRFNPFVNIGNHLTVFDAATGFAILPFLQRASRLFRGGNSQVS